MNMAMFFGTMPLAAAAVILLGAFVWMNAPAPVERADPVASSRHSFDSRREQSTRARTRRLGIRGACFRAPARLALEPTDLDTGVSAPDELDLTAEAPDGPAGAHEIERLLAGRFFTIGNGGTVSAWNARAQGTFGFTNAGVTNAARPIAATRMSASDAIAGRSAVRE